MTLTSVERMILQRAIHGEGNANFKGGDREDLHGLLRAAHGLEASGLLAVTHVHHTDRGPRQIDHFRVEITRAGRDAMAVER